MKPYSKADAPFAMGCWNFTKDVCTAANAVGVRVEVRIMATDNAFRLYHNPEEEAAREAAAELTRKNTEIILNQLRMEAESKNNAVNHPNHYNQYDVEVLVMMERIWGKEEVKSFCKLNAFKYRMRAGHKDSVEQDLKKEDFYLNYLMKLENGSEEIATENH